MSELLDRKEFWVPGKRLDDLSPITQEDLEAEFGALTGHGEIVPVGEVLGAMRMPGEHEMIHGVASIDLCEVLRSTALAMARTHRDVEMVDNEYDKDVFWEGVADEIEGDENKSAFKQSIREVTISAVMNSDLVPAVDEHENISEQIRTWRENGIFVVANTSTLPGCELATLRFLKEKYDDCFDGIVFPRNHDGRGKITKSDALSMVVERIGKNRPEPQFVLHIDDTAHHMSAMVATAPHRNMRLFMPRFDSNAHMAENAELIMHGDTPLEVFEHASGYIHGQLESIGHPGLNSESAESDPYEEWLAIYRPLAAAAQTAELYNLPR